jgi:hypothetical protein
MRRFAWILGAVAVIVLVVLLGLSLPTALDLDARATVVAGHEERLDELASEEVALQARIDEARADLGAQRDQNHDADERIAKQERRLDRLRDRIGKLEA